LSYPKANKNNYDIVDWFFKIDYFIKESDDIF